MKSFYLSVVRLSAQNEPSLDLVIRTCIRTHVHRIEMCGVNPDLAVDKRYTLFDVLMFQNTVCLSLDRYHGTINVAELFE